jgi:capsular polysaccharide biosynthesis protein
VHAARAPFDLVPRAPGRRLLLSRRDSPWRRIRNEEPIFHLLEPLGFELIVPGALSFDEQISAFRDATHIVSPHGAGLANILWCAPGTHVLEVFHPHYGTWAYGMLNDVLDLNYATLVARDADSDAPEFNDPTLPREQTVPHAGRDTWVDPDELERWLIESGVL